MYAYMYSHSWPSLRGPVCSRADGPNYADIWTSFARTRKKSRPCSHSRNNINNNDNDTVILIMIMIVIMIIHIDCVCLCVVPHDVAPPAHLITHCCQACAACLLQTSGGFKGTSSSCLPQPCFMIPADIAGDSRSGS